MEMNRSLSPAGNRPLFINCVILRVSKGRSKGHGLTSTCMLMIHYVQSRNQVQQSSTSADRATAAPARKSPLRIIFIRVLADTHEKSFPAGGDAARYLGVGVCGGELRVGEVDLALDLPKSQIC